MVTLRGKLRENEDAKPKVERCSAPFPTDMLGNTRKGPKRVSDYQTMNYALPVAWFVKPTELIRLR
jgi:hypothetical protein